MPTKPVFAEIEEKGKKVEWYFRPERQWLNLLKEARGKFVPKDKGGPFWTTPLDFDIVRGLGQAIGKDNLQMGAALEEWAWREKDREDTIREMLAEGDAELINLPKMLPELFQTLRPDQRVGVAYATLTPSPLIADEMGLGKTLEAIGAIFEAGTVGPTLIVAPLASAETVWEFELNRWQPHPVVIATGPGMDKKERQLRLHQAEVFADAGEPVWVVVNPSMVQFVKDMNKDDKYIYLSKYPWLHEQEWSNIVVDEIADIGMRHTDTTTARGMFALKVAKGGKRIAMTGTPWGGKPINVWGILHFLRPDQFSSKWDWTYRWLEVNDNGWGKDVEGIRPDRKDAFDRHILKYMIAREKKDVLKNLPPKQRIDVWCRMTPAQKKQYDEFARLAEITLGDTELSAASVLAEYTRLKQFAGALQQVKSADENGIKLKCLPESGKLLMLMDDLVHLGILDKDGTKLTPGEDKTQQAVVFSQFAEMVDMLYNYLASLGLPVLKMTGATKDRAEVQRSFQEGEARVMLMTTQTGGVSITLDRASNVFMMDEMWNPDKQRQAEDRCHRASRIHQVTIRYYRSDDTIEEYIKQVTDAKQDVNRAILDGQVRLYGEG